MEESFRVAFGHQARCGKDTAADILGENFNVLRLSFASPIKRIAGYVQLTLEKPCERDAKLYQVLGQSLKEIYGIEMWTDVCESMIKKNLDRNIVIADLRFPGEAEMLKRYGFLLVKIERENRLIDRDPNHISEIALKDYEFDITIKNNGSLESFKEEIQKLVSLLK